MAEYGLNLWDYSRIIFKRKWIIIAIFLVSIASSYLFVEKAELVYKSSITLYINTRRTPLAEITGSGVTFWGGTGENIATQLEIIRGYEVLKKAAERLGYVKPGFDEEKIQTVVQRLKGKVSAREQENTGMLIIEATDTNPVKAKEIVDTVANVYIEKRWEDKTEEAKKTKLFVEKQLQKINQTIINLTKRLTALGIEPGDVRAQLSPGMIDQRARLAQLKLEILNLSERYTDNYPGLISRRREVENIKKFLEENPQEADAEETELLVEDIDAGRLQNELEINRKLYALLKERYEKALILEASKTNDTEIVNPAVVPKTPIMAQAAANFFLAGVIGLILGLVAAFVIESMDTSIGTIEDVEDYLKLPVLGVIPQIDLDKNEEIEYWKVPPPPDNKKESKEIMGRLVIQFQPKSSVAEAYRNLQTYIKFSGIDKVGNCLMFTSAGIQEGKTITSVNSALSLAQMGYKVVLVDSDLRRPAVHKVFGISREIGLTEAVLGTYKLEDVTKNIDDVLMGNIKSSLIMKTYGMENLSIITSGHLPSNPSELLSSQNMTKFIAELKEKFDVVIFDTAPILPVTDSCVISSKVDGVVIVYKAGFVSRGALRMCKVKVENAKGRPVGVVLNNMRTSDIRFGSPFYYYYNKYYGGYHYGYGYGEDEPKKKRNKKKG